VLREFGRGKMIGELEAEVQRLVGLEEKERLVVMQEWVMWVLVAVVGVLFGLGMALVMVMLR
jgi:predicted membrane-bound spermidine synthase